MNKRALAEIAKDYLVSSPWNRIPEEKALSEELIAAPIFEAPIFAVAKADSPEFQNLKAEHIVGRHFMLPAQWLPKAESVISYFFPFTETIRNSNKEDMRYPSKGWMNGRIEGQAFINHFAGFMVDFLKERGFDALFPSGDERFFSQDNADRRGIHKLYTSNWSERHVAYVCGLGTFGLSKGIITEKGMAGRLVSIVTEAVLRPDEKKYQRFDENCTLCGKCIQNCPAQAISFEHGKDHRACSEFLNFVLQENKPWYGCGKCQVNVPCESRNPAR